MIALKRIISSDSPEYQYMESTLTSSFPSDEYRLLDELRNYTSHKSHFYNNIILEENNPIGFITYWTLNQFYYIEHFAIDSTRRNAGYGKRVIQHTINLFQCPIVLEVEIPKDTIAQRRISFYKQQGFILWKNTYTQPAYHSESKSIPMMLMAYGELNAKTDFKRIKEQLYKEIYKM